MIRIGQRLQEGDDVVDLGIGQRRTTDRCCRCGRWRRSTFWPTISSRAPSAAPSSTISGIVARDKALRNNDQPPMGDLSAALDLSR
ncbi:hypothetical protein [Mesorhizobium sp. M7A.F.Ca.US.008.03.1.1]|uniref:hypothetical protein n=1 Tax=Mesorhizobium sp. M7A.F.Ca.US.008.03.1.1 TaxID=2496742 RepID=UPI000FCC942E|nr:hypothetical protein EOA16_03710 [Mesorhizobium sp. M7A.F.Ca.US.008.03.1.1]